LALFKKHNGGKYNNILIGVESRGQAKSAPNQAKTFFFLSFKSSEDCISRLALLSKNSSRGTEYSAL